MEQPQQQQQHPPQAELEPLEEPGHVSFSPEEVRILRASVLSDEEEDEETHQETEAEGAPPPALQAASETEAVVESQIFHDNDNLGVGELEPPRVVAAVFGRENYGPPAPGPGRNEAALGGPQAQDGVPPGTAWPPTPLSSAQQPPPLAPAPAAADPYSFGAAWDQGLGFRGLYLPTSFPNNRNAIESAGNLKDDPAWQASPLSQDTLLTEELSSTYFAFLTTGNIAQQQWRVLDPNVFQQVCQQTPFDDLGGSQPALERLGRPHVPNFVQFCQAYAHAEGKSGGFLFWMAPKKPNATETTAKKYLQLKKQKTTLNNNNNGAPWWERLLWYKLPFVNITDDNKVLGNKLEPLFRKQMDERQAAQQQPLPPMAAPPQETVSAVPLGGPTGGGGDVGQGVAAPAPAPEGPAGAVSFPDEGGGAGQAAPAQAPDEGPVSSAAPAPEGSDPPASASAALASSSGGEYVTQGVAASAAANPAYPPRFVSYMGYRYKLDDNNEAVGQDTEEERKRNRSPFAVAASSRPRIERPCPPSSWAPVMRGQPKQD